MSHDPSRNGEVGARLPTAILCGIRLHAVTESGAVDYILSGISAGRGGWVITPNLDHLHRCRMDAGFSVLFGQARLVVADGMPLVWAARLQGTPLPGRVAGSSMIWSLAAAAAGQNRSIFLLGGDAGTAEAAGAVLQKRYPGLIVVGTACPPMGFENDPEAMRSLRQQLTDARPDIVFVALGSPKQERLIAQLRGELPKAWWLGVGISFSFVCGRVKRAPIWIQKCGLEWVHRLMQEPRRLAKRYLIDDLPFAFVLFAHCFLTRMRRWVSRDNGAGEEAR